MLWMGIWMHPYTVTPVWVGVDFRKIGHGNVLAPWDDVDVDGHIGASL